MCDSFETHGLDSAIKNIRKFVKAQSSIKDKILNIISKYGMKVAKDEWSSVDDSVVVNVFMTTDGVEIVASGEQVLFLEFGAGIRYSNVRNPKSDELGFGAGTYPSSLGNWDNPYGWVYRDKNGEKIHTYGNPAYMAMYRSSIVMQQLIYEKIVEEVRKCYK